MARARTKEQGVLEALRKESSSDLLFLTSWNEESLKKEQKWRDYFPEDRVDPVPLFLSSFKESRECKEKTCIYARDL